MTATVNTIGKPQIVLDLDRIAAAIQGALDHAEGACIAAHAVHRDSDACLDTVNGLFHTVHVREELRFAKAMLAAVLAGKPAASITLPEGLE